MYSYDIVAIKTEGEEDNERILEIKYMSAHNVIDTVSTPVAIILMKHRHWRFFVDVHGYKTEVVVSRSGGQECLSTKSDGARANSLLRLPRF